MFLLFLFSRQLICMEVLRMIEELAAYILGVDADENWEDLDDLLYYEFQTDLHHLELIVDKLMPMIAVGGSEITGNLYKGFADIENKMFIMKMEYEND